METKTSHAMDITRESLNPYSESAGKFIESKARDYNLNLNSVSSPVFTRLLKGLLNSYSSEQYEKVKEAENRLIEAVQHPTQGAIELAQEKLARAYDSTVIPKIIKIKLLYEVMKAEIEAEQYQDRQLVAASGNPESAQNVERLLRIRSSEDREAEIARRIEEALKKDTQPLRGSYMAIGLTKSIEKLMEDRGSHVEHQGTRQESPNGHGGR